MVVFGTITKNVMKEESLIQTQNFGKKSYTRMSKKTKDKRHQQQCIDLGWKTVVVWECELEKHLIETLIKIEAILNE